MSLSFFARPSYLGNRYPAHFSESCSQRLSSEIRGKQIAEYLGAKLNPRRGYENDVCIWVKPRSLRKVRDGDYVDCLDGAWLPDALKARPDVKAIAHTDYFYSFLRAGLDNKIVKIPHHHLNWENQRRNRSEVTTGGYIGSPSPAALKMYSEIADALWGRGFSFITCFHYQSREDAVNFYKQIDFLVVGPWQDSTPYKAPTKLINAASFGIPSIAYPLPGYKEFENCYLRAENIPEIVDQAAQLWNDLHYYGFWSGHIIKESERYHISKIAELYKALT